ncbi:MAG: 5-dehydro-2-deoxygluconokinase, partial [Rhodospirillales bacterium]|nr:5-dehydro-2-deoxygluconokinase [Rhodospirillales bacterium]
GDEHLGRFIREQLAVEGVELRGVRTDPERLTALVVLGIRDDETFPLIFYRENCADAALCEEDIEEDYVASAGALVVTGTHFSRPNLEAASRKAMAFARTHGAKVIFDIDYRPVLWGLTGHGAGEERFVESTRTTARLQSILSNCDLVVGTEEEIRIAGGASDTLEAIRAIRARSAAIIVCKRGPMGCVVFPGEIPDSLDDGIAGPGFPVEVYNVLGAGDAFMAGFLRGWLRDEALETCCAYANACGAFAVSRHGCAPAVPSWTELAHFLDHGSGERALRRDATLNHLHWATTRPRGPERLLALAVDHRSQFEDLAMRCGADRAKIGVFKQLALQAARQVAAGRPGFGILLDARLGRHALHAAGEGDMWVGRPVERPGSRPLEFECGPDLGSALVEWPLKHTVKCLVCYHPDDPAELRTAQEREVLRLFDACRRTGHELLLEVVAGPHGPMDDETVARALETFYDLGIRPDWWKLEPLVETAAWQNISDAIAGHDPHCRGVVVLGLDSAEEALAEAFRAAARWPVVKGFAVGRTIFGTVAEDWFFGRLGDEAAVRAMAGRFGAIVEAWERAKEGS